MWTKAHKIFYAALLVSRIPSLNKKALKSYKFSAADCEEISKLAAEFKTHIIVTEESIPNCLF